MKSNVKLDTLRHIKLGVNEVFYYDYDGNALPLRPISSYELDDCFYQALTYATANVANLVIKLRLKIIKKSQNVDFTNEDYLSLQRHYDSISYWIVFHSMKDFQDEDFSIPAFENDEVLPKGMFEIRKMNHIHNIASLVVNSSYRPKEFVKQIIKDGLGKEVAYLTLYFNVPLATIPDITRLQRDFLVYSKGEIIRTKNANAKTMQYEFSGKPMTIGDLLKKVGMVVPDANS